MFVLFFHELCWNYNFHPTASTDKEGQHRNISIDSKSNEPANLSFSELFSHVIYLCIFPFIYSLFQSSVYIFAHIMQYWWCSIILISFSSSSCFSSRIYLLLFLLLIQNSLSYFLLISLNFYTKYSGAIQLYMPRFCFFLNFFHREGFCAKILFQA